MEPFSRPCDCAKCVPPFHSYSGGYTLFGFLFFGLTFFSSLSLSWIAKDIIRRAPYRGPLLMAVTGGVELELQDPAYFTTLTFDNTNNNAINMISPTDDIAEVLAASVQWDVHSSARLISEQDLALILRLDKRDADTQRNLLAEVRERRVMPAVHTRRSRSRNPHDKARMEDLVLLFFVLASKRNPPIFFFPHEEEGGARGHSSLLPLSSLLSSLCTRGAVIKADSCPRPRASERARSVPPSLSTCLMTKPRTGLNIPPPPSPSQLTPHNPKTTGWPAVRGGAAERPAQRDAPGDRAVHPRSHRQADLRGQGARGAVS
jgi:hypothetical protein